VIMVDSVKFSNEALFMPFAAIINYCQKWNGEL
jgi:glycopeptide antibiotics resistance protein